jgi:hypothetical protein
LLGSNLNVFLAPNVTISMKRIVVVTFIVLAAIVLYAQPQREPTRPAFEVMSVFPRETSPGQYAQVDAGRIQDLSSQGWELVGVTPFIYRNEEHPNGDFHGPKPVVTQAYPAYYFKRLRASHY